jgi:hypothetical protein
MRRSLPFYLAPLLMVGLGAAPGGAQQGHGQPSLDHIQVTYHGGPLLTHVRAYTLFWGPDWKGSQLSAYLNGFFRTLFLDGRFMANLAQYSTDQYSIENGVFGGADTDTEAPPASVTDAQIRDEIRAQIAAGHLHKPDPNTVYFVFAPPHTAVVNGDGLASTDTFTGYHSYVPGSDGFAYAVIPYETKNDPRVMTVYASHELAEAVTDPQPTRKTLGWYDDNNGEISDIPVSLFAAGMIGQSDLIDVLHASDGTIYLVQKAWSLKANAPVAFADPTASSAG